MNAGVYTVPYTHLDSFCCRGSFLSWSDFTLFEAFFTFGTYTWTSGRFFLTTFCSVPTRSVIFLSTSGTDSDLGHESCSLRSLSVVTAGADSAVVQDFGSVWGLPGEDGKDVLFDEDFELLGLYIAISGLFFFLAAETVVSKAGELSAIYDVVQVETIIYPGLKLGSIQTIEVGCQCSTYVTFESYRTLITHRTNDLCIYIFPERSGHCQQATAILLGFTAEELKIHLPQAQIYIRDLYTLATKI